MVRLEVCILKTQKQLNKSFNSYMVRLEVQILKYGKISFCQFQFLYGAIGSISEVISDNIDYLFQFLYGAIGRAHL